MLTTIHLVTASDDRYSMPLATMLKSVERSLRDGSHVQAYVLDSGISESNKKKILAPLDPKKLTVSWINVDNQAVRDLPLLYSHLSIATYSRLFIGELLPAGLTKVIHLDADVVVLKDLTPLWQVELQGRPAAAVRDAGHPWCFSSRGIDCQSLGCATSGAYFNAGVVVIDLAAWRKHATGRFAIQYIADQKEKIEFCDQDGLNAAWAGRWLELSPLWNCQTEINLYPLTSSSPYDFQDFLEAKNDAAIAHFTGASKPWIHGCRHPYRGHFFQQLDQTAWQSWRPAYPATAPSSASDSVVDQLVNLIWQRRQLKNHGLPAARQLRGILWLCFTRPLSVLRFGSRRVIERTRRSLKKIT